MKNVLIVWENNPESVELFSLEVDQETYGKLCACHGKLVNTHNFDLDTWISEYIESIQATKVYDSDAPTFLRLAGGDLTIIHTGFCL